MTFQNEIQNLIDKLDATTPNSQLTKDILFFLEEWAIKERAKTEVKRDRAKGSESRNLSKIIILGAKIKVYQQFIDKCQFNEYERENKKRTLKKG